MKNCNLLNRIVPRACQSPRNFTNASAESLGTKLLYGHASTIGKPVIARRNNHGLCAVAQPNESFFHNQPRPQRGKSFCESESPALESGQNALQKVTKATKSLPSGFGIKAAALRFVSFCERFLQSAFCLLPSAFPHPTPSGRATYQISHRETFENDAASPTPHWPCAAPAIGERDRPGRTRRRLAGGIPFVSFVIFCGRFSAFCLLPFPFPPPGAAATVATCK